MSRDTLSYIIADYTTVVNHQFLNWSHLGIDKPTVLCYNMTGGENAMDQGKSNPPVSITLYEVDEAIVEEIIRRQYVSAPGRSGAIRFALRFWYAGTVGEIDTLIEQLTEEKETR